MKFNTYRMTSFKEFYKLQEVIDSTVANDVEWKEPPIKNRNASAVFKVGGVSYWITFAVNNASKFFNSMPNAKEYSVSFDMMREHNEGWKPVAQPAITTPTATSSANVSQADAMYSRTGTGNASGIFGAVIGILNQFYMKVNPEIISWIPHDPKLASMYKLLVRKFGQGKYTRVNPVYMIGDTIVRNDLLPYLNPQYVQVAR